MVYPGSMIEFHYLKIKESGGAAKLGAFRMLRMYMLQEVCGDPDYLGAGERAANSR